MDVCLLRVLCVVRYRSLRQADHSSREVLPTVMRRCVWSRNLKNEEAMVPVGPQRHRKFIYILYIYIYLFIYFSRPIFNTLWQFPPAIYILRGVVRNRKSSPSLHTDIEVSHISEVYTGSIPEASFCDSPLNSSCRLRCIRKRRETCHMFHQNSTQDSVNRHLDTGFSWFPCV